MHVYALRINFKVRLGSNWRQFLMSIYGLHTCVPTAKYEHKHVHTHGK